MRRAMVLVIVTGCLLLGAAPAPASGATSKPKFTLTSTAFANRAAIPVEYTCTGAGTSPPLAWTNVPKGTKQLALIVDDPDAPSGTFVHWVVAGFKPRPPSIAEGSEPANVFGGVNSTGRTGWIPPCPPPGPPHRYVFTLFALKKKITPPPGATATTLREEMKRQVLARAKLVGSYGR